MTCQELDERFDDLVDGALAGAEADAALSHLASCASCREREQALRQLLAHAAALPRGVAPPRDLWPEIAERIEHGWSWSAVRAWWQPMALATAAVIVVGAVALLVTNRAPTAVRMVAIPSASPSAMFVAGDHVADPVLAAAEREYEEAARTLLEALQRRRAMLPPEDLARVEANLQVIDRALAEVRQALVKDPASPELNHMLVATHRKKVDILQRVVRLSTAL